MPLTLPKLAARYNESTLTFLIIFDKIKQTVSWKLNNNKRQQKSALQVYLNPQQNMVFAKS